MPRKRCKKGKSPSPAAVGTAADTQHLNTNLLSLPTELLEMVVNNLGDEDVYSLSLLSKRLHFLALPIYCSRMHCRSLKEGYLHLYTSPLKILRAARTALYVQKLAYVSVDLAVQGLIPVLKGLSRLIYRMESVGSVQFGCVCIPRGAMDQAKVVKEFARLLEILACKSCTSVSFCGMKVASGQKSGPRGEISPLTALQYLNISSSILASSWIRTWIIRSINLSPITNLKLNEVALSVDTMSFGKDLCLLTLPSLTSLSLTFFESLQFDDIVAFLCRHHRIVTLRLKGRSVINSRTSTLPNDALPSLSTLETTPRYMQHFLRPRGSLPSLRHVSLEPDISYTNNGVVDAEDALACLAGRDGVSSLLFHLPLHETADYWLTRRSHLQRGKGKRRRGRRDVERSLVHIRTLSLDLAAGYPINTRTMSLIPQWFSLFPRLQHADFRNFSRPRSPDEEEVFMRAVADACPSMKTIHLGRHHRTAAELRTQRTQ
jgi:hypothetical protein